MIYLNEIYVNWRGVGTVAVFERAPEQSLREFWWHARKEINKYRMAGMPVYGSRRACRRRMAIHL